VRQLQEIMVRCAMKRSRMRAQLSRVRVSQFTAASARQRVWHPAGSGCAAADAVGIYAVRVEVKDDQATAFYREAMRFTPLNTEDGKLTCFFPVASSAPLL